MIQLTLSDEQAQLIAGETAPIDLVDSSGRMLGRIMPTLSAADQVPELSPEELAEIKRRMVDAKAGKGKFYTTQEVLEHLRSLETE